MMRSPAHMKQRAPSNAKERIMKKLLRTLIAATALTSLPALSSQSDEQIATAQSQVIPQAVIALFELPNAGGLRGGDYGV